MAIAPYLDDNGVFTLTRQTGLTSTKVQQFNLSPGSVQAAPKGLVVIAMSWLQEASKLRGFKKFSFCGIEFLLR